MTTGDRLPVGGYCVTFYRRCDSLLTLYNAERAVVMEPDGWKLKSPRLAQVLQTETSSTTWFINEEIESAHLLVRG